MVVINTTIIIPLKLGDVSMTLLKELMVENAKSKPEVDLPKKEKCAMVKKAIEESEGDDELLESFLDIIGEKWATEYQTPESKKGMFKGKNISDLESSLDKLKASGPHEKGSKEYTKMKQINFALRAKRDWPKD